MTNKQWAIANLTGKVLNRALRAIDEQKHSVFSQGCSSVNDMILWGTTKEGNSYWSAVQNNNSNSDKFLPSDYVEAPEYVGEAEAKDEFLEWLRKQVKAAYSRYNEDAPSDECGVYIRVLRKYEQLKK